MIDVESSVFTAVATALREEYGADNIYVSGEYVSQPPRFPAVSIVEMDNSVYLRGRDTLEIEHFAEVMYQVDVYSNRHVGKKAQAKEIIAFVDGQFAAMSFTRMFLNPVQNMNDATIYRMTARYRAVVGNDDTIYRR